jgi:hypothetical protein
MRFQIVYEATLNIEAFLENLKASGFRPETIVSSRNPDIYTDNFTFKLTPKVKVNVYPQKKIHKIQVGWNSVKEMRDHQSKLMGLFWSGETSTLSAEHLILNLHTPFLSSDSFLNELEKLYSKHMKVVNKREKNRKELGRYWDMFR